MVYTITSFEIVREDKGHVWREIFVSFIASIPFFTYGIESTSLASSAHSGHFTDGDGGGGDELWSTTAVVVAGTISAPVFCSSMDRWGRRGAVFVITLVQGASLIPLFLLNSTNTIVLHVLAGISAGGLFTVVPSYVREITSEASRGVGMLMMMVLTTAGYMMRISVTLEARMFLMTALVALQMLLMVWIKESPSFLVKIGKLDKAIKNLAVLRSLPEDSASLAKQLEVLKEESQRARSKGIVTLISFYRNKIWWDALKIGLVIHTTMAFCGSIVFLDQQKSLMQLRADFDPESVLVLTSMLVGSLISFICSAVVDRKYVLTAGYTIMTLASGVLAVDMQVAVTSHQWLPVAALSALVLGYGLSWGLITVIMAEIINFELRAKVLGVLFMYYQIIKLIHVHTFPYVEDYVGIYTMLYVFASINLYGAVYTLFAVPSIRNKSLKQIEKQLKRIALPA